VSGAEPRLTALLGSDSQAPHETAIPATLDRIASKG